MHSRAKRFCVCVGGGRVKVGGVVKERADRICEHFNRNRWDWLTTLQKQVELVKYLAGTDGISQIILTETGGISFKKKATEAGLISKKYI